MTQWLTKIMHSAQVVLEWAGMIAGILAALIFYIWFMLHEKVREKRDGRH